MLALIRERETEPALGCKKRAVKIQLNSIKQMRTSILADLLLQSTFSVPLSHLQRYYLCLKRIKWARNVNERRVYSV